MSKEIYINTNQESSYSSGQAVYVNVNKTWDPLSKAFKKHTYTIQYSVRGYLPSNYNIIVHVPLKRFAFMYQRPTNKVLKVEVYFGSNQNVSIDDPLILGFIEQTKKYYYTYKHLISITPKAQFLSPDGNIKEKDLVTRLLEEIGPRISREQKLVIRLGEKPGEGDGLSKYPESGHYKDDKRITVKKEDAPGLKGYDKYVHTVASGVSVEEFYVSYLNNSMYFDCESRLREHYLLQKVTAYFKNGSKNLVLIMFTLTSKSTYVYRYSDFVQHLKTNPSEVKEIGQLNVINPDKSLLPILKDESENLNPLIEFVKEEGEKNQNISDTLPEEIGQDTVGKGNKFVKVTMTPNASDEDKPDGSSGGPWKVYNSKLLNLEKDKKIPDYVLTRRVIFTNDDSITSSKYRSITVYYSTKGGKDYKALLVEFYASDMEYKTYFKRGDAEGTEWANETISTSNVDEGVLTRIAKEAKIIQEGSSVSSKGRPIGPSLPISGSSSSDVGGGGSVGVDSGAKGGHGSSSSRPVERGETSTRGTTGPSGENGDSGGNGNSNSDRGDGNTSRNEGVALTNDNHHSVSDSSTTYGQTSPQTKEKKDDKSDDSVSKKLKLAGAGVATTAIGAGAIGGGAHYAHGVLSVVNWLI